MNYYQRIEILLNRLDELIEEVKDLSQRSALAEATFKSEYAKTKLRYRYTAKDKPTEAYLTDLADDECDKYRTEYLINSARLNACRDAMRATQAQLDGLRTLAAGVRSAT